MLLLFAIINYYYLCCKIHVCYLAIYVLCILKESEAKEKGNITPPIAAVAGLTFSTLGESYYMSLMCFQGSL